MAWGWTTRPGRLGDAERLGVVHVRSWRQAYRGLVADSVLGALDPAVSADRWRALLSGPSAAGIRVAVRSHPSGADKIGAFSSVGPLRETGQSSSPVHGELYALYADPVVFGTGAGCTAHQAAVETLRADGYRDAALWVLRANATARRFYLRRGWRCDQVFEVRNVRGVPMALVRYSAELTELSDSGVGGHRAPDRPPRHVRHAAGG